jgi:hypothetical protein
MRYCIITIMKSIRDLKLNVKKMKMDDDEKDITHKQIGYFSEVVFGVNHQTSSPRANSNGSVGGCFSVPCAIVVASLSASMSNGSDYSFHCLSRSSSSGAGFSSNGSGINESVHPFSII